MNIKISDALALDITHWRTRNRIVEDELRRYLATIQVGTQLKTTELVAGMGCADLDQKELAKVYTILGKLAKTVPGLALKSTEMSVYGYPRNLWRYVEYKDTAGAYVRAPQVTEGASDVRRPLDDIQARLTALETRPVASLDELKLAFEKEQGWVRGQLGFLIDLIERNKGNVQ